MKGRAAVLWVLLQCKLASHAYRNLQNPCTFVLTFECQASSCQLRTSTQKRRKLETPARPSFKVKQKLRPLALQILTAPSTYFLVFSSLWRARCLRSETVVENCEHAWRMQTFVDLSNIWRVQSFRNRTRETPLGVSKCDDSKTDGNELGLDWPWI